MLGSMVREHHFIFCNILKTECAGKSERGLLRRCNRVEGGEEVKRKSLVTFISTFALLFSSHHVKKHKTSLCFLLSLSLSYTHCLLFSFPHRTSLIHMYHLSYQHLISPGHNFFAFVEQILNGYYYVSVTVSGIRNAMVNKTNSSQVIFKSKDR